MDDQELVSIITPLFNTERLLPLAIQSVLDQSYTNWEMIIIDDCSTDGSPEIAANYSNKDPRIKFFQQSVNSGPAACRNVATEHAQGRYVAFLDSDDMWSPEKLSRQIAFMQRTKAVLSYTSYKKINNDGDISQHTIHAKPNLTYKQLLNSNEIGSLTAVYDSKEIGKQPLIDIDHEDYVLWLSILKKGYTAYGLDEVLAYYRIGNASISSNKLKAMGFQWNIYRNIENLSLIRSLYHFMFYAYRGYKKFRLD